MTRPDVPRDTSTAKKTALLAFGAGVSLAAACGYLALRRRRTVHPHGSAPGRTALTHHRFGDYAVVGRTVTINRPRPKLYAFWRNFANLPKFMSNVTSVEETEEGHTRWLIQAPGNTTVTLETEIVEDRPNEMIAWRSTPNSQIDTEGRVNFREAPDGRGTEVEAIIAYKPPAGDLGRLVAKLFQREPNMQARHELKRFKMLMEAGEIADPRHTLDTA